ncbi:MAG: alpha/beta hydrolase [Candidatus Nitrosopolaris sp.]
MNKIDSENYKIPRNEYTTIKVNGHTILYNESKNRDKKHILFIHGIGSSSIAWRDIPDALSEQFHTIAVDLIGFGGSDKPQQVDYTVKGLSKFIIDFLEAINLKNEKVTIVGHSLGGYIALRVAIENKNLVEKIVLIDSSGLLEKPTPSLEEYRNAAMEMEPVLRYKKLKKALGAIYADPSYMPPFVVNNFIETIIKEGAMYAFENAYEDSTKTHIESDEFKRIHDIPCSIICGIKDNLIPIEYYEKFKDKLPNAKNEKIDGAGRAPFVEKTTSVYELIRTFITDKS